jgi:hypothetical protein
MSEHNQGGPGDTPADQPLGGAPGQQPYGAPGQQPYGHPPPPNQWGGQPPAPYGAYPVAGWTGQPGTVRSTGMSIFLFFITFGIYGLYWIYVVHDEMKRYKGGGDGIGGLVALLIYIVVSAVSAFLASMEVGQLYERAGRPKPVSGTTGLWYFPGVFILVGPFIWFIKTNGALNDYWESVGAAH